MGKSRNRKGHAKKSAIRTMDRKALEAKVKDFMENYTLTEKGEELAANRKVMPPLNDNLFPSLGGNQTMKLGE
jgi:hypothetical protein